MARRSLDDIRAGTDRCSTQTSQVLGRCHLRQRSVDQMVHFGRALIASSRRMIVSDAPAATGAVRLVTADALPSPGATAHAMAVPLDFDSVTAITVHAMIESAALIERARIGCARTEQQLAVALAAVADSQRLLQKL
jgi:hypothetical protein